MALLDFFPFGKKEKEKEVKTNPVVVVSENEDAALQITDPLHQIYQYYDLNFTGEKELVMAYRDMAQDTDIEWAIGEYLNEFAVFGESNTVTLNLDDTEFSDNIKKKIADEFDEMLSNIRFKVKGEDWVRRFLIDGKIAVYKVVNEKGGIVDIRIMEPWTIKPVQKEEAKILEDGKVVYEKTEKKYLFQQEGDFKSGKNVFELPKEVVSYVHSGILSPDKKLIYSILHKALRPFNILRMTEDSVVIYRWTRAPERRVFYVDVGNLPKTKAEQFMRNVMNNYKNKVVYDSATGKVKDAKNHMSMLEDIWLPRREGSRGTEVQTLPGGAQLGEIDDLLYARKKLYRALGIPMTRIDPEQSTFSLGRAAEISRDEYKFDKTIARLRGRFSKFFLDLLKDHLVLKKVITPEEWDKNLYSINVIYKTDMYFSELKESEILKERLDVLNNMENYIGKYFSHEWVRKNVLKMSDEDLEKMDKQIQDEKNNPILNPPEDNNF